MPAAAAYGGPKKQKTAGDAAPSLTKNAGTPAWFVQNTKCKPDA